MKVSTKGRYGLRAMVELADSVSGDHIPLSYIAQRQEVSENYLEQVFATLRKAGLVRSVKGAQGGYVLAEEPEKITVGNILRVLEGDLTVVDPAEDRRMPGTGIQQCIQANVWDPVNRRVNEIIDTVTLQDLVLEYRKTKETTGADYCI